MLKVKGWKLLNIWENFMSQLINKQIKKGENNKNKNLIKYRFSNL